MAALLSFTAHARSQIISERSLQLGNEQFIERTVSTPDKIGKNTEIVQVLRKFPDGNLEYVAALQPDAARQFDRQFCDGEGEPMSDLGVATWSPETIHGYFCSHTFESIEAMLDYPSAKPDIERANADEKASGAESVLTGGSYVESFAPGGYIVPKQMNSMHYSGSKYS